MTNSIQTNYHAVTLTGDIASSGGGVSYSEIGTNAMFSAQRTIVNCLCGWSEKTNRTCLSYFKALLIVAIYTTGACYLTQAAFDTRIYENYWDQTYAKVGISLVSVAGAWTLYNIVRGCLYPDRGTSNDCIC